MISFTRYLAGTAELAAVIAALAFGAYQLRGRLMGEWTGAPARLAEAILAVGILIVVDEALGTVGLFKPAAIIPALIAAGIGVGVASGGSGGWHRKRGSAEGPDPFSGDRPRRPPVADKWGLIAALLFVAFIVALWSLDTQRNFDRGMYGFDTLWYHMPFAASYLQSGSITGLHYTDPLYLNWFYPANSELVHATGALFYHRDILSPFINLGWLGLALLAAWCIGRPYGVAPLSVIAVVVILGARTLEAVQPGDAKNDIVALALLMSSAALLLSSDPELGGKGRAAWPRGPLIVAGLAAGLAVGTKLDLLAAVAALTVGVIWVAPADARRAAAAGFGLPMLLGGGFWFARNLVAAGNPLPWIKHLGPISLPHPARPIEGRAPFTVAHYLFDSDIYRHYFFPGLKMGFGHAWPVLLGLAGGGMILATLRGTTRASRMIGAFAVFSVIAYLFTPLSASGPEGMPVGFFLNLRYVDPALAIGLALLPLFLGVRRGPAMWAYIGAFVVLLLITDKPRAIQHSLYTTGAVLFAVLLVALPFLLYMMSRRGGPARALPALAASVLALAIVAVGWPESRNYLRHRYTLGPYQSFNLDRAYQWARDEHGQRIGLAGTTLAYFQYGLYGTDLSNRVTYIGEHTPHGGLQPILDCAAFRTAVNDGRYAFVVTSPFLNQNDQGTPIASPERGWLRPDPAAKEVLRDGGNSIFQIRRPLDPAACGRLGARARIPLESLQPPQ